MCEFTKDPSQGLWSYLNPCHCCYFGGGGGWKVNKKKEEKEGRKEGR